MNKRWYFRTEKRPVGDRPEIESPVESLFRVLSSNVFGQNGSSPQSLRDRNHGRFLLPVRVPIRRKHY